MKRLLLVLICGAGLALWAQEAAAPAAAHEAAPATHEAAAPAEGHEASGGHEEGEGKLELWKWANFAILAVGLGYVLKKALPPFFASRTAEIQRGIAEAREMKAGAEKRAAEMERRMAALGVEVDGIRDEAKKIMSHEAGEIAKDTEAHMARIQSQAEQEISALTKHATQALKAHAAQLALELASQRIQASMTVPAQGMLVEQFVKQLDRSKGEARI